MAAMDQPVLAANRWPEHADRTCGSSHFGHMTI
jgi:hypothetical protein